MVLRIPITHLIETERTELHKMQVFRNALNFSFIESWSYVRKKTRSGVNAINS